MKKMAGFLAFSLVFLWGCGGGGAKHNPIVLKLTQDGKPYAAPAGEKISVQVVATGDGKGAGSGELQPDGRYLVGQGAGVPPGKYEVFITRFSEKADNKKGPPARVKLKGTIDVSGADKQEISVDVGK